MTEQIVDMRLRYVTADLYEWMNVRAFKYYCWHNKNADAEVCCSKVIVYTWKNSTITFSVH